MGEFGQLAAGAHAMIALLVLGCFWPPLVSYCCCPNCFLNSVACLQVEVDFEGRKEVWMSGE